MPRFYVFAAALALPLGACKDVEDPHGHPENEFITTVAVAFAPVGGGDALTFRWSDPENDGSPVIDDVVLADASDYTLTVQFLNDLEEPPEDITAEVQDESDQHQVFFTGSGVQGPATGANAAAIVDHTYADTDANGLPVGLLNDIVTIGVGEGELEVTLRHMPPENDAAVKLEGAAEDVAAGGFGAIGGDNDVQVVFPLRVE